MYFNCLLPEWIVQIFMEKYRLTREKALQRFYDQEKYLAHVESKEQRKREGLNSHRK